MVVDMGFPFTFPTQASDSESDHSDRKHEITG